MSRCSHEGAQDRIRLITVCADRPFGQFRTIVDSFGKVWDGTVLDVGCRNGELAATLADRTWTRCWGLDLNGAADVIADLEAGLPFRSAAFDTVVALEVLEHIDRLHKAFQELFRVARRHVLISLPNLYEVRLRARFMLGSPIGGKYGLPLASPPDRHRWLFPIQDAIDFCRHAAAEAGGRVADEAFLVGSRRAAWLGRTLVRRFPGLFAVAYVALVEKGEPGGVRG